MRFYAKSLPLVFLVIHSLIARSGNHCGDSVSCHAHPKETFKDRKNKQGSLRIYWAQCETHLEQNAIYHLITISPWWWPISNWRKTL